MKNVEGKNLLILDIFFICLFLMIFIWTLIDYRMMRVYVCGVFTFLGFVLLYSKRLKDFSFIERGLYWISQNVTLSKTKYNHIFGGLFFLLFAFLSFAFPPKPSKIEDTKLLWDSLVRDPSFWMVIIIVLILNLGIGFYMSRKRTKY